MLPGASFQSCGANGGQGLVPEPSTLNPRRSGAAEPAEPASPHAASLFPAAETWLGSSWTIALAPDSSPRSSFVRTGHIIGTHRHPSRPMRILHPSRITRPPPRHSSQASRQRSSIVAGASQQVRKAKSGTKSHSALPQCQNSSSSSLLLSMVRSIASHASRQRGCTQRVMTTSSSPSPKMQPLS